MISQRITFGKQFLLDVVFELGFEKDKGFLAFLQERDFKYSILVGYGHKYYAIECEDFTEAAAIETFLYTLR